jgi:hypothetical protein
MERYFSRKYYKNKNQETQQQLFFSLLGVTENGITQKPYFYYFFKLGKLVEDYHLLLPLKTLEGGFCCLENIDF